MAAANRFITTRHFETPTTTEYENKTNSLNLSSNSPTKAKNKIK